MDGLNVWDIFLETLDFVLHLLIIPRLSVHQSMSLADDLSDVINTGPMIMIMVVGQFVRLDVFFLILSQIIVLEGVRLYLNVYRTFFKLTPFVD